MKKAIIFFLWIFSSVATLTGGHLAYLYFHQEFKPRDFIYHFPFQGIATLPGPAQEVKESVQKILDQKFTYLGRGKQMTAFESADHHYVIKFFNPRQALRQEWFSNYKKLKRFCSMKWISGAYFERKARLNRIFHRYRVGFDELKEEAGLIYIHLDASTSLPQTIDIVDKYGKQHALCLEKAPFVLQKKSEVVKPYLRHFLANQDYEKVKEGIGQLCRLFVQRAKKGYTDRHQTLYNNFGFVEGEAIQIDLGRIDKDKAILQSPEQEVARVYANLEQQLIEVSPEHTGLFIDILQQIRQEGPLKE